MARPPKSQDHVVHRIAELIHMADAMHDNEEVGSAMSRGGITLVMADGHSVNIDTRDEIAVHVGRFIFGDFREKTLKAEASTTGVASTCRCARTEVREKAEIGQGG